jgi:hypothetical protein
MADGGPRVFISYSHDSAVHAERALQLANRLRSEGVDAEIDRYNEAPPDGWPLWMRRQVVAADFVLCVCTDVYKRRFEGDETPGVGLSARWEAAFIRQALYKAGATNTKFIPVLLDGATTAHIPAELEPFTYYVVTEEDGYERLYRRLTDQPETVRPPLGERRTLPPRRATPAMPVVLPWPRNPFFVGRHDLLAALRSATGEASRFALVGMGGIGKSQLAVQHAYSSRDDRRAVLWTGAAAPGDVESGFANLARGLGLVGDTDKPERAVEAMAAWLASEHDWLLIFDNVEDADTVRPWLGRHDAPGQVVVTTRHAGLLADERFVDLLLAPLRVEDTVDYVARRLSRDRSEQLVQGATALHDELGGLPLALAQAASFIRQTGRSLSAYVAEVRESQLVALERGSPGPDYSATVATTFATSLAALRARSEAAADMLALTVALAPEPIPTELLVGGRTELGDRLAPALHGAEEDPLTVWELLQPLRDLSLAVVDPDLETVTVHRLIRETVRQGMTREEIAKWERRAVRALERTFPVANYRNWPLCDRFLPHARHAAELVTLHDLSADDAGYLLNETASYLRMRGEYAASERMHLQALTSAERRWGAGHPNVGSNYNNISLVYFDQFDFDRAIRWRSAPSPQ